MQTVSTEKVPNGKLLRVKVDFDEKIGKVQITGDFFAYPEDIVERLESSLIGINVNSSEEEIRRSVESNLKESKAEIIGIDAESIARNLKRALGGSK